MLESKADKDAVNRINMERASLAQVNEVKNCLRALNDRLKSLSVISGEIVQNMGPKYRDDEGTRFIKLQRNFNLINQLI